MAGGPVVSGGGSGSRRRGGSGTVSAAWVLNLLTDLAFNLLIFFVVIASNDPVNKGRTQQIPAANKDKAADTKGQNIEVWLKRQTLTVNGADVPLEDLAAKLKPLIAAKPSPEDKIVVVKSDKDAPYARWIKATGEIERAGGMVALQLEEEKETVVK